MSHPRISVLIANVNGSPMIEACLDALAAQPGRDFVEVIVADGISQRSARLIKEKYPWVKLLSFTQRLTIPELRTAALAHSCGEIIAVIEDHVLAGEGWYQRIIAVHHEHPEVVAVGGAVENASRERLLDWAVFFCEYCAFMPPIAQGAADSITGNNVSYKRRAFESINQFEEVLTKGFWETMLHKRLQARGERFFLEPSIVVYHKKRFGFSYFLNQRYHYSRYYAGTLYASAAWSTRLFRSAISLALPVLLMVRMTSCVLHKKRHRKEFVLSTPLIAVFTLAWAWGELVGLINGPGESLRQIE